MSVVYMGAQNWTQFWMHHAGKSSSSPDLSLHTHLLFQSSVPWYSFQQVCKVQLLHTFPSEVGVELSGSLYPQPFTIWFLQCKSCSQRSFVTNLTAFWKVPNASYFINNPCEFPVYFMGEKTHINFLLEPLGSYNAYSNNQSFTLIQISPVNIFTNNLIAVTRHSKIRLTWA